MNKRSLYIAVALIFIVSLALSLLVILTEENGALGPRDPLYGKVVFSDGKMSLTGTISPDVWKLIQQRYMQKPVNNYTTYSIDWRSPYPTALVKGTVHDILRGEPGPSPLSFAQLFGHVIHDISDVVAKGLKSGLKDVMGFFAADASAANTCGSTNRDCCWTAGSGNWSAFATHWLTETIATPLTPCTGATFATASPVSTNNVFFDSNSCSAACTVTLDATPTIISLTINNANVTLDLGANTLTIGTAGGHAADSTNCSATAFSICVKAGNIKSSSTGTLTTNATIAQALQLQGGFIDFSGGSAKYTDTGIAGGVNVASATSYIKWSSSTTNKILGPWTNSSTSASWGVGTGTLTIASDAATTITPGCASGCTNEFFNLILDHNTTTARTYTLATNTLRWSGLLTVQNSAASSLQTLDASAASTGLTGGTSGSLTVATLGSVTINTIASTWLNLTLNGATGGVLTLTTAAITTNGNWDSSTGTFTKGTSTITMAGTTKTVKENGTAGFASLSITGTVTASNAINVSTTFTLTSPGTYTTTGFDLNIGATTGTGTAGDVLVSSGGTFTMSGAVAFTAPSNWDSSGGTFTKSTSTVTMSGTTKTVKQQSASANGFYNLTVSGTVTISVNPLDVTNTLATSGSGVLTTGGINITGAGSLSTVGTGGLTATTSTTTFLDVTVGSGTTFSYTSGACTCSGNWDSSAGTFTKGTSTVTMSGSGKTVKENGTAGFNNLSITGTITASNAINVAATFTLTSPGTYTTTSADLNIGATTGTATNGDVLVSSGGTFTMSGAVAFTAPSNWDSSGGTFTKSTSTVTMSGTSKTVKQQSASTNGFYNLTISGTVTISVNPLDVTNTLATSGSGTLTTGGINITGAGSLSTVGTGGLTATTSTTTFLNVTVGTGTTFSYTSGACTCSGNWDSSAGTFTKGTSTVTMTGASKTIKENGTAGFNNLIIDTGASITASSAINVGAVFQMNTTGTYTTTGQDLFIGSTTSTGTAGDVTVSSGGTFTMNGSVAFTAPSNWDSSGGTFTKSTSTVTMSGTTKTVKQQSASANGFYNLTVSGTVTISVNPLDVSNTLATSGSGVLTTGGINITGGSSLSTAGTGGLTASTSTTTFLNVTVGAGTTFSYTSGACTCSGNWDSSAGTFTKGTSTVTMSGSGKTVKENGTAGFNNLTITGTITASNAINVGAVFTLSGSGATYTTTNADLNIGATTGTATNGDVLVSSGGTFTMVGSPTFTAPSNWDSSAGTFTKATSTVTMSGTTKTVKQQSASANGFYNLTVSGTVTISVNPLDVSNTLATSGSGVLTTGGINITGSAAVSLVGTGGITGTTSTITVGTVTVGAGTTFSMTTGTVNSTDVTMTGAGGTISFSGSGAWNASGNWDTSGSTSTFTKSTSVVTLSGTSKTVKILNASNNFYSLTISGTIQTAGDISNSAAGTLSITGTYTLVNTHTTNGGTVSGGGNLTVNTAGVFDATSTTLITLGDITMTSATSGTITLSGSPAVSIGGNWNTSGTGTTFTKATSTVTMTGASKTVAIRNSSNGFYNLTIAGSITMNSAISVDNAATINGSQSLTLNANNLTVGASGLSGVLTVTGNLVGTATATGWTVTDGASDTFTVSAITTWTANSDYKWTDSAAGSNSFTIAINVTVGDGTHYDVRKDGADFANGTTAASKVTFTMLPSDPVVEVTLNTASTCSGGTCYWISATGNFDQGTHWSTSSGGALCQCTPGSGDNVVFDASSGTGTATQNIASFATVDVTATAGSMTIALSSNGWTASGNWDTSGGSITLTKGTSTVTLSGTTKTVKIRNSSNGFYNLTISGTVTISTNALDVSQTLATSGSGTLTTGGVNITGGAAVSLVGTGGITGTTSTITVGAVTIGNGTTFSMTTGTVNSTDVTMTGGASGVISFSGAGAWNASGNWDTSGAGSVFTKGTSTVTLSGTTKTVKTLNSTNGFYNLTTSGTITMSNATDISNTLSVSGTLATADKTITGGSNLSVPNGGTLTANASTATFTDVTMTGGTSGTITLTSGSWTVHGNWDTSGAGSTFTQGTSTVTMDGTTKTLKMLAATAFATLVIAGTISLLSDEKAKTLTINNTKTLMMGGFSIFFNHLDNNNGGSISSTAIATGFDVTNSDSSAYTKISIFSIWNLVAGEQKWTHTSDTPTSTMTFTISGLGAFTAFSVTKDGGAFTSGAVVAGVVTFTMLGSDPVIDVTESAGCTPNCYWVGGGGNWSDGTHWASVSGGAGQGGAPQASNPVFFDANSGVGTVTVDVNATMASFNSTASTIGTIAIGTKDFNVNGGAVTHAAGTITISTGTFESGAVTLTSTITTTGAAVFTVGAFTVSTGGTFTVNTASVASTDVTMTSASSGTITMTSGSWTASGNWDTSGTGTTFTKGTGTVTLSGTTKTAKTRNSTNGFYNLTISGTITQSSSIDVSHTLSIAAGTLTTSGNAVSGDFDLAVTSAGSFVASTSVVSVNTVTMTDGTASTISMTSGVFFVDSTWDTSGANSTFTKGTGTVSLGSGGSSTVKTRNSSNGFFDLTISAGSTVTQSSAIDVSDALLVSGGGGTLVTSGNNISGGAALTVSGTLTGTTAVITVGDVTVAGTLTMTSGAITASGNWDTSAGTFTKGTSTVTLTGASKTISINGTAGFASLVINGAASYTMNTAIDVSTSLTVGNGTTNGTLTTASLALSGGGSLTMAIGTLTANASTVTVGAVQATGGTNVMTLTSGSWTVSGNWDTSGGASTFTKGTSTVTLTGASKTVAIRDSSNGFYSLAISGTISQTSAIDVSQTLATSGSGALTTSGNNITGGAAVNLVGTGGITGSTATITVGVVTVGNATTFSMSTGTVNSGDVLMIGGTSGTISFSGAGAWNTIGNWDTSGAGSTFTKGSSTVTMSGASKTVKTLNSSNGFYGLTVSGTVTMLSAIDVSFLTTISGTLAAADFNFSGDGGLTISTGGTFTANASTVTVKNVTMTSAVSGTITITSGQWTVSGNWDTSGTGTTFTSGSDTVTMSGSGKSVALRNSSYGFDRFVVSGSITQGTDLWTRILTVTGSLTKIGFNVVFNSLTATSGSIVDSAAVATNFTVTNSDGAARTTISVLTIWSANSEFKWTHTSSVGTTTITFTIGGNTAGNAFAVKKDGSAFTTGVVNGSGQVVFTMLGSDPVVDVTIISTGGTSRYLVQLDLFCVLNGKVWSDSFCWAATSGGPGGAGKPDATIDTFMDANSGATSFPLDQNGNVKTLDTTAFPGTFAIGSFNFTSAGAVLAAGGTITISTGTFTATTLTLADGTTIFTVSGSATFVLTSLTVTGNATFNANAGTVSVGNVTMNDGAASSIVMTSGSWDVSGNWDTSSATFTKGTGTITLSGTAKTVQTRNASNGFYNLTVSGTITQASAIDASNTTLVSGTLTTSGFNITGGSNLSVSNAGTLAGSTASMTFMNVSVVGGVNGTITMTSGSITALGNWDTSGTGSVFTKGTSTVTMSGSSKTVKTLNVSNGFYNLTISGTITMASAIDVSNATDISGTLATADLALTGDGALTVETAGTFTANASMVVVSNVTMTSAVSGTITLTSGSWTVSGNWNTSGSGTTFTKGTSTVTLSGATKTLAIRNASNGFYNLTVSGSYTMSTLIDVSNTLTVSGTLATANFAVSGGANLSVTGTLTANASTVTVANVTASGSGTITLTTGSWTVSGNWDTSGASTTFTAGTSTVTMSGSGKTVALLNSSNGFSTLIITGSITASTSLWASILTVNASGSFNMASTTVTVSQTMNLTSASASITGASYLLILSRDDGGDAFVWTAGTFQTQTQTGAEVRFSGTSNLNIPTTGVTGSVYFPKLSIAYTGKTTSINNGGAAEYGIFTSVLYVNGGIVTTTSVNEQSIFLATVSGWGSQAYTIVSPTAVSGQVEYVFDPQYGNSTWTIPGGSSYGAIAFGGVQLAGQTQTFNFAGSVTASGLTAISNSATNSTYTVNQSGFSLTTTSFGGPDLGNFSVNWNTGGGAFTTTSGAAGHLNTSNLAGGTFTGTVAMNFSSSVVTIAESVLIHNASDYFVLGSSTWTVAGTWDNQSTSSSWNAGTSSVTFTSSSSISFDQGDSTNYVGGVAFNNVAFQSSSGAARTFTLSTHGLKASGTLTVSDTSGTTELATANLSMNIGPLVVGNAGILTANASTVVVSNVTMTSGSSGTITLTTGTWTASGNWNTSGVGSTFTAGTSSVTMSGASKTVALLNSSNGFDTLVVSGTITANSSVWARILTVTGTLTKTGQSIVFKTLTVTSGSIVDGAVTVTGFQVGNSEAGARTTISAFTLWTIGTEYKWNHTSSSPTTTITFTIGGNVVAQDWLAKKNAVFFSNGLVDGSGNIVFTMLGSDPAMDITTGVLPRYLVLNDGACVPTAIATTAGCWSLTSGGAGGSTVPDSTRGAYEDANSGAGTGTFDAAMSVNFWNMTAFTGTIDTAGFNLTIVNALTVQSALLSGSSAVIVGGGVTILTTSSYITNGVDGIWTVSGGNWSNASTSPSWSFFSILRFSGAGAQSVGGSGSKNVFHSVVVSGGDKTFTQNFTTSGFTASGNVNMFITASTVTWTIRAASVIRGVVGTLTIRSTVDGTHWVMIALDVPLGVKAFGVNVKDSDASGGSTIDATDCSNFDAGGNLNWLFGSGCAGGGGGGGGGGGPAELTLSIIQTGDFTFEFTVTGNRGPLTYISWSFGDGSVVNNGPTTISHSYRQSGAFTVTVSATMAATQYSARATVYTGAPLAFGYLLAIMVSITILAVLLLRKNEKLRSRVAILALGLLALQISAYFNFQETALYMSIVTLGFAAMALALAVLPRAPTRPRGLWIIIGVLALLLWIYLALPLPSL